MVILQVKCTDITFQHEGTGQEMTVEEAREKMRLIDKQQKRDLNKIKTTQWNDNMFQKWLKQCMQPRRRTDKSVLHATMLKEYHSLKFCQEVQ